VTAVLGDLGEAETTKQIALTLCNAESAPGSRLWLLLFL